MALAGNILPDNICDFEGGSHAWTQGSNTTIAINTGGTISGNNSIRATATAAGAVNLTSARFAVTPGTDYEVVVPVRTNVQKSGRTLVITLTWYTALSGGSQVGTASYAHTMPGDATTGWQVANYGVLYATAPANAVAAALTLQVTGLAASEFVHFDRLEMAPAVLLDGNLFSYNTQANEQSVSGWTATGGTLERVQGSALAGAGTFAARAVASAAGTVAVRTASKVPVTPDQTYVTYMWVATTKTGGYDASVAFRWYDGSDTLIASEVRTHSVIGSYSPACVVGDAPAGAATVEVEISWTADAAGENLYFDHCHLRVAPNPEGNLLTYDEYSTESRLEPWTVDGPGGAPSRALLYFTISDGFYMYRVEPTGTGIIRGSLDRLVPVEPGKTYEVAAIIWRQNPTPGTTITSTTRVLAEWYDENGEIFQTDTPDQFYTYESDSAWLSHSLTQTRTCPEGAAYARVIWEVDHPPNGGSAYYVDKVRFTESIPEYELAVDDERGCITLTSNTIPSHGLTGTVSVYRVHQDGSMNPLRGYGVEYDRAPFTSSPMVIEDYEAPMGETVWYKIDWFTPEGNRNFRQYTRSVRTPVLDDPDYVWFKSPGLPATNTRVMMEAPPTWQRVSRSSTYEIVGRKNPVHVSSLRAGRTSEITILVWDEPSNELFNQLLDSGLPALIQAMPGYGIDGNLYISIGDSEVESVTGAANEPGWRWTLPITEIDRPVGGLQGSSGRTWQDVADDYESWEDVFDAYDAWSNVLTEG